MDIKNFSNVLEFLEISAKKTPDKIAFIDINDKISFAKILYMSKRIASGIIKLNQSGVIIFAPKSINTLLAMFGVVYAGKFYSIFDLSLPSDRLEKMAQKMNAKCLLCDKQNFEKASKIFKNCKILLIENLLNSKINEQKLNDIRANHKDSNPLYCNFTSGTTGEPKGVLISHLNVINFIPIFTQTLKLNKNCIFANQAPFDFDVSVKDIYSTLFLGATCALIPREFFTLPIKLMDFLEETKANTLIWAVSALIFLNITKALSYKNLAFKKVIYSGEIMPKAHLLMLSNKLKKCEFINVYGPTEITCNCTFHILSKKDFSLQNVPIGKAFRNRKVFLLNSDNKLVTKAYKSGELCVSGNCIGLGYLGDLNNKAFCQNPLNKDFYERIYRTGDLAYFDEDGKFYYKGRLDFQVKRLGHRIELREIELAAENFGVKRACAILKNEKLTLFCEGEKIENLAQKFREKLPFFMLPNEIKFIDKFVLNKNGKIDRNLLK